VSISRLNTSGPSAENATPADTSGENATPADTSGENATPAGENATPAGENATPADRPTSDDNATPADQSTSGEIATPADQPENATPAVHMTGGADVSYEVIFSHLLSPVPDGGGLGNAIRPSVCAIACALSPLFTC